MLWDFKRSNTYAIEVPKKVRGRSEERKNIFRNNGPKFPI